MDMSDSQEPGRRLMTLAELAERWGVPKRAAAAIVRRHLVPFLMLGSAPDMRVSWRVARFRPEAIEEWERGHQVVCPEPAMEQIRRAPPAPRVSRLGNWRGTEPAPTSRLGNWRDRE
jgi:hypothetical protein